MTNTHSQLDLGTATVRLIIQLVTVLRSKKISVIEDVTKEKVLLINHWRTVVSLSHLKKPKFVFWK